MFPMDVYEATRIVLSRIQNLDPTNASKIMGLLLLQDHGEKEMIRLTFGPQNLLHSVIAKAKTELGLMADDLGFGLGHCSYLCNCKFVHGGVDGSRMELLRSKSVPPRLAHQFTGGSPFQFSPKGANLLQREAQRVASLMKLGRWRAERTVLAPSRQIYLTFPADSMFREEDVSNYFSSTYGPVEDVRIPYQQKRMFGFVTFVYPETVKSILAKGNPHFVCDSRVLVKPYKEKGKVPDKYRSKPSPTGLDSRDLQLGGRAQDLYWKRMFEERALELESTRLMNLQILDVNKHFQLSFDQTRQLVNQRENDKGSGSDEDTIKLPESLEDSPFASPTRHFHTNGSGPQDESKTSLSESFKSFNCQMPSLSVMGMLPGPVCRVGI